MQGIGKLVFKSIEVRDGGKFVNERGQEINYATCYIVKCDEVTSSGIDDVKFKIPEEEKILINAFKTFAPYDKIELKFDVTCNGNNLKLIPTEVKKIS